MILPIMQNTTMTPTFLEAQLPRLARWVEMSRATRERDLSMAGILIMGFAMLMEWRVVAERTEACRMGRWLVMV